MPLVVAALPTPFNTDLSVDFAAFRDLIAFCAGNGVDAILVGGTTGEFPSLTIEERRRLILEAAEGGVKQRFHNISACSVPDCIALARDTLSADVAPIIMAPWYFRDATEQGVADFLIRASADLEQGVFLYNYPAMNGFSLTPAFVKNLMPHVRVLGVKDSGKDYDVMKRTARLVPERNVFAGSERFARKVARDKLAGVVTGSAIPVVATVRRLFDAEAARKSRVARASEQALAEWDREIKAAGGSTIAALKAALSVAIPGFPARCRAPLSDAGDVRLLTEAIKKHHDRDWGD